MRSGRKLTKRQGARNRCVCKHYLAVTIAPTLNWVMSIEPNALWAVAQVKQLFDAELAALRGEGQKQVDRDALRRAIERAYDVGWDDGYLSANMEDSSPAP